MSDQCNYHAGDWKCRAWVMKGQKYCRAHIKGYSTNRPLRGCGCLRDGHWKFCPFCGVALPDPKTLTVHALKQKVQELEAQLKADKPVL